MGVLFVKMKYIENKCPKCQGQYEFLEQEAGRDWTCPHCGFPITLRIPLTLRDVLRWVAVLPGAWLAWLVSQVFLKIAIFPMLPEPEWMYYLESSVAGSFCYVLAGATTAPRFRFETALILTVIFGIIMSAAVTFFAIYQRPLGYLIFSSVAGIITTICVCVALRKPESVNAWFPED